MIPTVESFEHIFFLFLLHIIILDGLLAATARSIDCDMLMRQKRVCHVWTSDQRPFRGDRGHGQRPLFSFAIIWMAKNLINYTPGYGADDDASPQSDWFCSRAAIRTMMPLVSQGGFITMSLVTTRRNKGETHFWCLVSHTTSSWNGRFCRSYCHILIYQNESLL